MLLGIPEGLSEVEGQTEGNSTFNWVWWYNRTRLMGSLGYVPPAEYEERYYEGLRKAV